LTPSVKHFIEIIAKAYLLESPIVEIGSLLVKNQESLANIRSFSQSKNILFVT